MMPSTTNKGSVTGNATFNDSSYNSGTVTGDATFNDDPYNIPPAVVIGDATFYGHSRNEGTLSGNVTFAGSSYNKANIAGDVTIAYARDINGSSILGIV